MITPKKILVIRFSSLGDIVLTTPVYKNIKRTYPQSFVAAATKKQFADILSSHPCIDEVFALESEESILHFAWRLRQEQFDTVIDLHGNLRSRILCFLLNAAQTVRYKKASWQRRYFVARKIKTPELEKHTIERYLECLRPLHIQVQTEAPEIYSFSPQQNKTPLRFLIVQTAFLGDAVLTLPLLSALKEFFPSSDITILTTPEIKEIFQGRAEINTLLEMDKRKKDKGIGALFRWAQQLKNKYDIALVPHRSFRSALLVFLSGTPRRIGFSNSQGKFFLTDRVAFNWTTHDSERNLKLLEALGISQIKPKLNLDVPIQNREALLRQYQIDPKRLMIGINPSSVWKTKRWIPEYFASVADQLVQKYNAQIVFFGSGKDKEVVDQVLSFMKFPSTNLCEKTDLKTLIALIAQCQLFITNDSGPMHLASASKVPVVAIFGPTTKELGFFPYGEKSAVVDVNLPCRPCSLHGGDVCPLTHFKCMREVTPEMVLQQCIKFLETL